ncbi:hypothetical protein GCM10023153_10340 [Ornithinibacter aureus]|uniref:Transposase n=1 Tax=Ornithinibacter aureus TaxID=622664 RepID=A0ABP8JK73_9MICO
MRSLEHVEFEVLTWVWAACEELEWGPLWGEMEHALPAHPQAAARRLGRVRAFLAHDVEIRRALLCTNAIKCLNARYRRAVGAWGHIPTEQPSLKTLYLVARGMDPKGTGQARWTMR